METENELNNDIIRTTAVIQEKFPELSKYITEMPVTIPNTNDPSIDKKSLKDFKDSLKTLLKNILQIIAAKKINLSYLKSQK